MAGFLGNIWNLITQKTVLHIKDGTEWDSTKVTLNLKQKIISLIMIWRNKHYINYTDLRFLAASNNFFTNPMTINCQKSGWFATWLRREAPNIGAWG